jgi:hypothetical protein
MERSEIIEFVSGMKPKDHVIMFYSKPEDKREVLFAYLKAGLDDGEAAAYVAGQESPEAIGQGMKSYGVDVDVFERSGALHIINYSNWYAINGAFSILKTLNSWKKYFYKSITKGFKGLRIAGEMACFFENRMVKELVEYEKSLHRTFEVPMSGICAYDSEVVGREENWHLFLDLIRAHSSVIITGGEIGIAAVQS